MALRFRVAVVGLLLLFLIPAQRPSAAQATNGRDVIPFDTAVRTGTLPNGLRYYIRQNERPANRVLLRLVVKAGSLDEADDQQGLAHFVEHMAFNGSTHFKPGELVSYFESTGARLGPHVNAYTSFEETAYQLELPTDRAELLEKAFTALADFGGGLTFDPEQVDRERGVVIEEWRLGLGAGSRMRDKQIPFFFYRSRYAERLPIGKPEVIRTAPVARLRAFYDAWYRPELMAVVAVGHVEVPQIEATIRNLFGPLKARTAAAPRSERSVPPHVELLVNVTADPEVTSSSVQLMRKRPREGEQLIDDYRRGLVGRLFERMLNERFGELARKPDATFLAAGAGDSPLGRTVNAFGMSARVKDGAIAEGLAALEIEARRVREFGFTANEWSRARLAMLSFYERPFAERDKTESAGLADEYIRNFLVGEPSPGIEYEFGLVRRLMNEITLDEITSVARTRLADANRVILATSPQKADLPLPAEAALRAALSSAESALVTPPSSESDIPRELMPVKPQAAAIVSRRELQNIGVTVLRFANGVEAWLKPTDFKNDQVVFTLSAPGGLSLAAPADFVNATLSPAYVRSSGLANMTASVLQKVLAGSPASAGPNASPSAHSIGGSSSPHGLDTSLQLLHLFFTAPGDDPDAFALMKRQLESAVANRGQNPAQVFSERVAEVNSSNHYTSRPLTAEVVASLDRAKMAGFYRDRFTNAADFTFFMVGAFKVDDVAPLLARYVGSLPSTGTRTSRINDVGIRFPEGIQRAQVDKGREPRGQTVIGFFADPSTDSAERERLAAATSVLQTVLRDVLRESLGQTYGVSVGAVQMPAQRGGGHIRVSFAAAPENIAPMVDRVLQEVKRLQADTPPADIVAGVKESARRQHEVSLRENGYWLGQLQNAQLLGKDPEDILTRPDRIAAITPAIVQEMFGKYFPLDRYTVVTLLPEAAVR